MKTNTVSSVFTPVTDIPKMVVIESDYHEYLSLVENRSKYTFNKSQEEKYNVAMDWKSNWNTKLGQFLLLSRYSLQMYKGKHAAASNIMDLYNKLVTRPLSYYNLPWNDLVGAEPGYDKYGQKVFDKSTFDLAATSDAWGKVYVYCKHELESQLAIHKLLDHKLDPQVEDWGDVEDSILQQERLEEERNERDELAIKAEIDRKSKIDDASIRSKQFVDHYGVLSDNSDNVRLSTTRPVVKPVEHIVHEEQKSFDYKLPTLTVVRDEPTQAVTDDERLAAAKERLRKLIS